MTDEEKHSDEEKNLMQRDWTKGNITTNLWSLAWPMTISSVVMMIGPTIDMIWIGKLGPDAMAAVGISGTVVMLINSLIMGLFAGLRALVARFVGAGDSEKANHAAQQGLIIGAILSLIVAAIGFFLAESVLRIWDLEPAVVAAGAAYMRIELVGIFTMSFGMMAQSTMQASGDAKTPMKISIGTRLFHIVLCPFLIFGWWGFPELGVRGAAFAAVISQGVGGAIGLWILSSGRTRLRLTLKNFSFDRDIIWRIARIGIPASISGIHMNIGNIVFMWFITPFGTLAVAGHYLVSRVDIFVLMPAIGLGSAAGILAAQNLGAGQPGRSVKTAWIAVGWFTGIMFIISLVLWFWADPVVSIFNNEPDMVAISSTFLKIQIASYMMNGLIMVLMSCLNSVGDTLVSMIIDVTTMWGIRVPLAIYLPKVGNLGVYGVRWALVADTVFSAFVFIIYFVMGRWKHKRV